MFLAIDVGNTHTTFGIFKDDKIKFTFRISTKALHDREVLSDFLNTTFQSLNINFSEINKVGISYVVPSVDNII
ncbi:MAG: type III pantothenate kinase, partial [Ignavibacteria bacterium]